MAMRLRIGSHLTVGLAGLWLLAAAGAAGTVFSAGCGKVSSTPTDPGSIDSGLSVLELEPAATSVAPGAQLQIRVIATDKNNAPAKEGIEVVFTLDNALGSLEPANCRTDAKGEAITSFRAGTQEGTTKIRAAAGGVSSEVTVQIAANAPPPPPPTGGGGADGDDALPVSLDQVGWSYANPASWPVTAELKGIKFTPVKHAFTICAEWEWPRYWPMNPGSPKKTNADWWIIAQMDDGSWRGSVWNGVKPTSPFCTTTENLPGEAPFIQTETRPLNEWHPKSGQDVYFMISTIVRGPHESKPQERSQVFKTRWP